MSPALPPRIGHPDRSADFKQSTGVVSCRWTVEIQYPYLYYQHAAINRRITSDPTRGVSVYQYAR